MFQPRDQRLPGRRGCLSGASYPSWLGDRAPRNFLPRTWLLLGLSVEGIPSEHHVRARGQQVCPLCERVCSFLPSSLSSACLSPPRRCPVSDQWTLLDQRGLCRAWVAASRAPPLPPRRSPGGCEGARWSPRSPCRGQSMIHRHPRRTPLRSSGARQSLLSSVGTWETPASRLPGTPGVRLAASAPQPLPWGVFILSTKSPRNRKFSTGGGGGGGVGRTSSGREGASLRLGCAGRGPGVWLPSSSSKAGLIGAEPRSHKGRSPSREVTAPLVPPAPPPDTRPGERPLTSCGWDDRGPGAGGGHCLLRDRHRPAPAALPQAP